MGTSSGRRPPTTRLWRRAKLAATRYLDPERGRAPEAREVVARYLAALGEGAGPGTPGLLAGFRLTRKVGQNLGAFLDEVAARGWNAAGEGQGADIDPGASGESNPATLAGTLLEEDGGLEAAVARSALVLVLRELKYGGQVAPGPWVSRFLGEALYQRLVLDLGESLEAASGDYHQWRQGLQGLRDWIIGAGAAAGQAERPTPKQWRGLGGWQWVTLALENLLERLQE